MKLLFGCHCEGFVRMTRKRCMDIAWYLVLLHEHHQSFHHGGTPSHLSLCLNPTQAYPFHPSQIESKVLGDGRTVYCLKSWQELAFRTMRATVLYKLSSLSTANPNWSPDDPFAAFRHNGLPWIDLPDVVKQPNGFAEEYSHLVALEWEVGLAQLWLHFTDLLCDLMATITARSDLPHFDVEAARGSRVLREAHNTYIQCKGAPESLRANLY